MSEDNGTATIIFAALMTLFAMRGLYLSTLVAEQRQTIADLRRKLAERENANHG